MLIQVHPVRSGRVAKREATHVIEVDGRVRHRQCRWTGSDSEWSRRRPRHERKGPGIGGAGGLEVTVSGRDVDLATGEDLASAMQVDWKW